MAEQEVIQRWAAELIEELEREYVYNYDQPVEARVYYRSFVIYLRLRAGLKKIKQGE